jgi:uncharacterized protein with gpF-like domain
MLRFLATQDGNTRDEHAALHGIIKPVDDPFWESYFPPLDWNCRCRTERLEEGTDTDLKGVDLPPVEDQFKERVTDSKKIWHEDHPYFKDVTKTQKKTFERFLNRKYKENDEQ